MGAWDRPCQLVEGKFHAFESMRFTVKQELVGYSVHGFDPSVTFRALPGEGGLLPDGLSVDSTMAGDQVGCATVRIPLSLFDHEGLLPHGARAVRVRLTWKVLARTASAKDLPAVKLASSEQGEIDADGQQKLLTYYTRNVLLAEDGSLEGTLDLPMLVCAETRMLAHSKDVVYGPVVFIPAGWHLEFRDYAVDAIEPGEVPPIPAGEPESFVAWYLRNASRPATIDLDWRTPVVGGP